MREGFDKVCPKWRDKFASLKSQCETEFGWHMLIVDVIRTPEEQAANLKNGVSWTSNSKHLPQAGCCGLSHAVDMVPLHLTPLKGWAPGHPDWLKYGLKAESLGMGWGGRWKDKKGKPRPDCPHVEVPTPKAAPTVPGKSLTAGMK